MNSKSRNHNNRGCLLLAAFGILALALLTPQLIELFRSLREQARQPLPVLPPSLDFVSAPDLVCIPIAHQLAYPLGSPRAALAYNAQPFTENNHLGDDWNGSGGYNTDMGDPVYVIGNGLVTFTAKLGGGWGGVAIVQHRLRSTTDSDYYVQSFYGHLNTINVRPGQIVWLGQQLGTVGNAGGRYWAHLHLEVREFITRHVGAGYRTEFNGWLDPTGLIESTPTPPYLLPIGHTEE